MKEGYIHFGNLCNSLLEVKAVLIQSSIISSFLCNMNGKFFACFKGKVSYKTILHLIVKIFKNVTVLAVKTLRFITRLLITSSGFIVLL